jgi:hypothetical protein
VRPIAEFGLRFGTRLALIIYGQETGAGDHAATPLPFGPNTPVVAACSLLFSDPLGLIGTRIALRANPARQADNLVQLAPTIGWLL